MPLADTCGRIVNGHPCMRVPGHTGIHIPVVDSVYQEIDTDWNAAPLPRFPMRPNLLYFILPAIGIALTVGFQVYIDTLVILHWGWLCLLSGSRYAVSNVRVISPAS